MLLGRANLQKIPSELPEAERLQRFLDALIEQRGKSIAFVVLFGSRARGDWLPSSDFDILVGLADEDGKRLIDRMAEFYAMDIPGDMPEVEIFPYSRSEWQRMVQEFHPLLLEALAHGVVLWDRGEFAVLQKQFRRWREEGQVRPWRSGWIIAESAERTEDLLEDHTH